MIGSWKNWQNTCTGEYHWQYYLVIESFSVLFHTGTVDLLYSYKIPSELLRVEWHISNVFLWARVMCSAPRWRFKMSVTDMSSFHQVLHSHLQVSFFASLYIHSKSVIMYVCTHPYVTYSSSSSINLHHHMAKCRVRWQRGLAVEAKAVQKVQVESAVQQRSSESAMTVI